MKWKYEAITVAKNLTTGFFPSKKKVIDIKVRDASSVLLLGRKTKIENLPKQLAEKIAVYKKEGLPTNAPIAQVSAERDVKMATLQHV